MNGIRSRVQGKKVPANSDAPFLGSSSLSERRFRLLPAVGFVATMAMLGTACQLGQGVAQSGPAPAASSSSPTTIASSTTKPPCSPNFAPGAATEQPTYEGKTLVAATSLAEANGKEVQVIGNDGVCNNQVAIGYATPPVMLWVSNGVVVKAFTKNS
ncbi:MAG: hypothetical protein ACLQRH_14420 [Acidimicrobiales bacterium]